MINLLQEVRNNKKNVFVIGNGGSSSTASHFVCDLLKTSINNNQPRFRAQCLSDNTAVMTAWSNDVSYDDIFSEQLKNFVEEGDILIAISCSGNSTNVIKAVDSSKSGVGKGAKSDVQLYGTDESTPLANLSLKQDGGFIWASVRSDLTFSPFIKTFLKKLLAGEIKGLKLKQNPKAVGEKYLMYNDEGERVTLVVIDDFPKGFEERVIFGNESPKVIVIGRTFNDSDFQLQSSKLNIKSSGIYRTLEEVDKAGQSPTFLIAQHINMPYGLDFRIFPAQAAKMGPKSKGIKLHYNEIVTK